jgi:hypothetical protein
MLVAFWVVAAAAALFMAARFGLAKVFPKDAA